MSQPLKIHISAAFSLDDLEMFNREIGTFRVSLYKEAIRQQCGEKSVLEPVALALTEEAKLRFEYLI